MEHRYTERMDGELKILIYRHNLPIAIGRVKNGSHRGMFVETDYIDVECEHQLSLEVLPNRLSGPRTQRLEMKAIVTHKTNKGFGAELDFQNNAQTDLFLQMLCGRQSSLVGEPIYAMAANS